MGFGDLAQALPTLAVSDDRLAVERQRRTADDGAFEAGTAHAGLDPFDDQAVLQFGDGADDDEQRLAQRSAGRSVR